MATGLVVLAVGAGLVFAHAGAANTRPPAHTAITERTPPLCQLVRRPGQPPTHAKSNLM